MAIFSHLDAVHAVAGALCKSKRKDLLPVDIAFAQYDCDWLIALSVLNFTKMSVNHRLDEFRCSDPPAPEHIVLQ